MARTFAYCRVSTLDQTTDNQIGEIEAAGFAVDPKRVVTETVSGSTCVRERSGPQRDGRAGNGGGPGDGGCAGPLSNARRG